MRGKGTFGVDTSTTTGITPAYAGKSFSVEAATSENRDHPRLCGEKRWQYALHNSSSGSPPPMRGKASFTLACDFDHRITPAYAGKSHFCKIFFRPFRDHPRLCGEKHGYYTIEVNYLGSPPPMRGKDNQIIKQQQELGITPAYAGKSCKVSCSHRLL